MKRIKGQRMYVATNSGLGLVLATAVLLGGCAGASNTDPRAGGLAGGINALATGAYDKRLEEREATLRGLEASENVLASRVSGANDRLATVERQIAARKASLAKLQADAVQLEKSIDRLKARAAVTTGVGRAVEAENERRRAAIAPLQAQLATLRGMTDELERNGRQEAMTLANLASAAARAGDAGSAIETGSTGKTAANTTTGAPQPSADRLRVVDAIGQSSEKTRAEADVLVRQMRAQLAKLEG